MRSDVRSPNQSDIGTKSEEKSTRSEERQTKQNEIADHCWKKNRS